MPGPAASGPYRVGPTVLCCALPLLTLGILGMVPSTVLAVGRRRPVDIVGAVVFGLLQLTLYVSAALAPKAGGSVWDTLGMIVVMPMWIGAPLHFLLMNRRSMWPGPKPLAQPYPQAYPTYPPTYPTYPQQAAYPQDATAYPQCTPYPQPYPAQPTYGYPPAAAAPAATAVPAAPTPAAPVPGQAPAQAPAPSATGEELRQLGELLRRQAQEGRP
ncbi:hypothetical protein ACGFX4_30910 [Kitasatospora sp. NPDC048365]|uniref:hypothetical protein n=1 Tax=Kitasatospora sp. NPDC048365 TaxID=3364050 RepID=UPI0037135D71